MPAQGGGPDVRQTEVLDGRNESREPMAAVDVKSELATLEEARSRLEAALSGDENWRALRTSVAGVGAASYGADRRARDARLEKALDGNPLYQAWKHMSGAIAALHATARDLDGPSADHARPPPDVTASDAAPLANGLAAEELPEDIKTLIRRGASLGPVSATAAEAHVGPASASAAEAHSVSAAGATKPVEIEVVAPPIVVVPPAAAVSAIPEPAPPPSSAEAQSAPAAAATEPVEDRERVPPVAVVKASALDRLVAIPSVGPFVVTTAEPVSQRTADPTPAAKAAPQPSPSVGTDGLQSTRGAEAETPQGMMAEPDEATVTFVLREARPSLLPSAELPADLGTERKSTLFERLRGVREGVEAPEEAFTPLDASAEEADVVIVTPEGAKAVKQDQRRLGDVQRFLRALSGGDPPKRD